MNKTVIWVLLALVVIAVGAFLVMGNKTDTKQDGEAMEDKSGESMTDGSTTGGGSADSVQPGERDENGAILVAYTGEGFTPRELQINAGDVVRFENRDNLALLVVGTEYEDGKALDGFDAPNALGTGESYLFTFTSSGVWAYKNSTNSAHVGTIVVFEQETQ